MRSRDIEGIKLKGQPSETKGVTQRTRTKLKHMLRRTEKCWRRLKREPRQMTRSNENENTWRKSNGEVAIKHHRVDPTNADGGEGGTNSDHDTEELDMHAKYPPKWHHKSRYPREAPSPGKPHPREGSLEKENFKSGPIGGYGRSIANFQIGR